jgi:hypothetical protein
MDAAIGRINDVLFLEDQILVAEGMSHRVLAFSTDGRFSRAVGRGGTQPVEFRSPHSLVVDHDGTIIVADISDNLTRLTPDLDLVDVYTTDVPIYVGDLAKVGDGIVLFQPSNQERGDNFVVWDSEVGSGASFDPRNELVLTVPLWSNAWTSFLAVGSEHLYVADNMAYPIRRYTLDHQFVDTVGASPPSWRQAAQPTLGEFATRTGRQVSAREWLRAFTRIDGLFAVGDDWLVVTHRDPVTQSPSDDLLRADIYHLESGFQKVWEDIPLPGPIVEGGSCARIVVARPPEPWTLACWSPGLPPAE